MSESVYDIAVETLDGKRATLRPYAGKVMLVVNTASQCGFTPQYAGLEKLHEKFGPKGLAVLGFPCNQFGRQEPGTAGEIAAFCERNYGVSFPLHAKVDVNGPGAHPLFRWLKNAKRGFLGTGRIKWNFTKFLIDRQGSVVKRYAPSTDPKALEGEIERLLAR